MWIKYEPQGFSPKLFKLLIVKYLFLSSFHIYLVRTSLYQATLPSPIPNSFTKRICFYFVLFFNHAVIPWRDQFEGLVSANLLETATNASLILAAQKDREKNEKVSPQGVITWSPKAWENRGGDNPRQLIARGPFPVYSSLTLC